MLPVTVTLELLLSVTVLTLCTVPVSTTYVPSSCSCPKTLPSIRGQLQDFYVIKRGAHCKSDEIIVTLKKNKRSVCLSPESRQGKRLLRCWNRLRHKGQNTKACVRRRQQRRKGRRA